MYYTLLCSVVLKSVDVILFNRSLNSCIQNNFHSSRPKQVDLKVPASLRHSDFFHCHFEPPFRALRVTYALHLWLFGNPVVDFIFVVIELFRYLLRLRRYGRKSVEGGVFRRGGSL